MRYMVAGYVVVLGLLALYAAQLAWRRRRLTRAVLRAEAPPPDPGYPVRPADPTDDR